MTIEKTILDLFVARTDAFAEQNSNGSYTCHRYNIDENIIREHLSGKRTVGAYQIGQNNKCKWVCFDFDGTDLTEQLHHAKRIFFKLRDEEKIKSGLLEFSGKKGYHVWIFIEENTAASAKIWAEDVSRGYDVHEIFPKQSGINESEPFGNLVKLPLCIHKTSGKRSVFLDDEHDFKELTYEESIEHLKKVSSAPKAVLPKVILREITKTIYRPATEKISDYVRDIINTGTTSGKRHETEWIIAKEMYKAGKQQDAILAAVLQFNSNCKPPKEESMVINHINALFHAPEKYFADKEKSCPLPEIAIEREIDYDTVMKTYKKWIYFGEDDTIIDLALAIAITRTTGSVPLWLITIAPSGSGKSEVIRPFTDKNDNTTEIMSKITPNTFLSGLKDEPDFAETLRGKPKLFLTFDFSQFVKLHQEVKGQIWAQLRDLYDGFIERRAAGMVNKKVENIRINWLICSTPIIDSELLVQQELGTRELLYRFNQTDFSDDTLMSRIWENSETLEQMRNELAYVVRTFINKKEHSEPKMIIIPDKIKTELMKTARMITFLRAATESDSYTGELTNFVYREMPTRVLLQLKVIYGGLKSLSDDYPDERALKVIRRVALSSIHPLRLQMILKLIESDNPITTNDLTKKLNVGWKTLVTQLMTARQLGMVDYIEDAYTTEEGNRNYKKKSWFATRHDVIAYLKEMADVNNELRQIYGKKNV